MSDPKLLQIATLGGLSVCLDGDPVTGLASRKVEALLVYLACTGRAHPRETLAEMFWPERTQAQAMSNLRVALSSLRKHLGPFVTITRDRVVMTPGAAFQLDVAEFDHRLDVGETESAADLYQGDFLEGFYIRDCPAFEDWASVERERLHHTMLDVLKGLVASCTAQRRYQVGITHASRMLQIDPLTESAHRQIMRLLDHSGQRSAALAQFETCRRVLADELSVEPDAETLALYQQIQAGELEAPSYEISMPLVATSFRRPAFLDDDAHHTEAPQPVFVAREREMDRLDGILRMALGATGQVVFITGGPGRGKTALLDEFARRAMDAHPDLLVASGNCNAFSGVGDPYLPFRDVFAMLTGDVEDRWAAGSITQGHAQRLWRALPVAIQALLDYGPHLTDALVRGPELLARASAAATEGTPLLESLKARVEHRGSGADGIEQSHLFQQATNVLHAISQQYPLLLVLDDLQWADSASIGLLFHLGSRLGGSRTMLACAYRPEEITLAIANAPAGERVRHPLEKTLNEFERRFGDVWVDMAQIEPSSGRRFVDAILDAEANHLSEGFRRELHQRTDGHALFTVELLRAMQERGDVVQDEAGCWVEEPLLDWNTLPPRVEGVIRERIGRLEEPLREMLCVASVEGETFTAQVIARVQGMGERQALQALSQRIEKHHRLVREQETLRAAGHRLSRFRFSHALFQQYLYHDLGEGERRLLHGEVAAAMEALYATAGSTPEITVQLARHCAETGDAQRARKYFTQAGDAALAAYANREAERHYRSALKLAPSDAERAHLLSGLGQALERQGHFRDAIHTWREGIELNHKLDDSDGVARLYARLILTAANAGDQRERLRLCLEGLEAVSGAPESPGLARLLHSAARTYIFSGLLEEARPLCQRAIEIAERHGAVEVQADALATLGPFMLAGEEGAETLAQAVELAETFCLLRVASRANNNLGAVIADDLGKFQAACDHFRRAEEQSRQAGRIVGQLLPLRNLIETFAILGQFEDAEESLSQMQRLVTEMAERSRAAWIEMGEMLLLGFRGEWAEAARLARAVRADARERGAPLDVATANTRLAWALLESFCLDGDAMPDELSETETQLSEAIAIYDGSYHSGNAIEARVMLGKIRLFQGRFADARSLLEDAQKRPVLHAFAWNEPRLLAFGAQLDAAEERWPEALATFERAAGHYARMEARWYWARTLLDWADALIARGGPENLRRARSLLRDSQAAFDDMGITVYAAVAEKKVADLEKTDARGAQG